MVDGHRFFAFAPACVLLQESAEYVGSGARFVETEGNRAKLLWDAYMAASWSEIIEGVVAVAFLFGCIIAVALFVSFAVAISRGETGKFYGELRAVVVAFWQAAVNFAKFLCSVLKVAVAFVGALIFIEYENTRAAITLIVVVWVGIEIGGKLDSIRLEMRRARKKKKKLPRFAPGLPQSDDPPPMAPPQPPPPYPSAWNTACAEGERRRAQGQPPPRPPY